MTNKSGVDSTILGLYPDFYDCCGRLHPLKAKPRDKSKSKKPRLCISCQKEKPVEGYFMCSQCQRAAQKAPALFSKKPLTFRSR